jgi:hypothetical protein
MIYSHYLSNNGKRGFWNEDAKVQSLAKSASPFSFKKIVSTDQLALLLA